MHLAQILGQGDYFTEKNEFTGEKLVWKICAKYYTQVIALDANVHVSESECPERQRLRFMT